MAGLLSSGLYTINHLPIWRWPTRLWGHRMVPPSADRLLHLWLHRTALMGEQVRKTLAYLVKPGMRVLDIGANQGVFTTLFSDLVKPDGHVDAFEPDPVLFDALSDNLTRNKLTNVDAHCVALGDTPGTLKLRRSALNSGDNRLGSAATWTSDIAVPLDLLDQQVTQPVDFIKMDVQGHELAVLQGARQLLARSRKLMILTEYWPAGLRMAGVDPAALPRLLSAQGFQLYDPDDWSRPRPLTAWVDRDAACDVLAVRE